MKQFKQIKKQLILKIAEKHFAEKGYEKTQIRDIAKEVEMSVGTIYNLFKSKEDLFSSFVENKIKIIMDNFYAEVSQEKDPVKRLQLHITAKIKEILNYQALVKVNNVPYNLLSFGKIQDNVDNPKNKIIELLEETIRDLSREVKLITDDYIELAYIFLGLTDAYIQRWMYENVDLFDKKDEILKIYLKSIRA